MPEMNALPEKRRLPFPRTIMNTPNKPMDTNPMANLLNEHARALQPDSRTKIHRDPINIAANVAARNALRYPLFMLLPFSRARELYHLFTSLAILLL